MMPVPLASSARIACALRGATRSAALRAFRPRPGNAGIDAFLNDRAFELGEHTQHLKQRPPCRRGCIDGLPFQIEIAADHIQLAQGPDQILQAAPEPVDRPCCDDVDLAPRRRLQQPVEARSLVPPLRAAHAVIDELLDDTPATGLAYRSQRFPLVVDRLLAGRDTQVHPDALTVHAHLSRSSIYRKLLVSEYRNRKRLPQEKMRLSGGSIIKGFGICSGPELTSARPALTPCC